MELYCPLCKDKLEKGEGVYRCANRHSFDIARQGYVHLLPVQQKHSVCPGDTRQQVLSRREFLDGGFYAPIAQALCDLAAGCRGPVLDVGCGEGYYGNLLAKSLDAPLVGVDISKEAVRCAAARYKDTCWICASAAHLPLGDASVGVLSSLFAVTLPEEFSRVLRPGGVFLQVVAAKDHLLGLKHIIYPELTEKEKEVCPALSGFCLEKSVNLKFSFTVEGAQVQNLLSMTPHVYRITKQGAQNLENTRVLTDEASCVLNLYRKPVAFSRQMR